VGHASGTCSSRVAARSRRKLLFARLQRPATRGGGSGVRGKLERAREPAPKVPVITAGHRRIAVALVGDTVCWWTGPHRAARAGVRGDPCRLAILGLEFAWARRWASQGQGALGTSRGVLQDGQQRAHRPARNRPCRRVPVSGYGGLVPFVVAVLGIRAARRELRALARGRCSAYGAVILSLLGAVALVLLLDAAGADARIGPCSPACFRRSRRCGRRCLLRRYATRSRCLVVAFRRLLAVRAPRAGAPRLLPEPYLGLRRNLTLVCAPC